MLKKSSPLSVLQAALSFPGRIDLALLRNDRTKARIRSYCYAGVRRLEAVAEERQSSDDQLRRDGVLPAVFTTSSRDYQKLTGLQDTNIDGCAKVWGILEETEIPQLRMWLHAQGQKVELQAIQVAEEKLAALCHKLQEAGKSALEGCLSKRWVEAQRSTKDAIAIAITRYLEAARTRLRTSLMKRVDAGQRNAAEAAVETMEPKCRPKGQGGLHHGTFHAAVRRNGEWREDWNELLSDPINRAIAIEWNRSMQRDLPECIDAALKAARSELQRLQAELSLLKRSIIEVKSESK